MIGPAEFRFNGIIGSDNSDAARIGNLLSFSDGPLDKQFEYTEGTVLILVSWDTNSAAWTELPRDPSL